MSIFLRKRTHRLKSGLSAFLALALLWSLSLGSWPVLADAAEKAVTHTVSTRLQEDISKRSEYEKTYIREEGKYVTYIGSTPVHRKDANGNWQEIDLRLSQKNGNFVTADGSVTLSADKAAVTWGDISWQLTADRTDVSKATVSKVAADPAVTAVQTAEQRDMADKGSSQLFYLNKNGSGVRYTLSAGRVKEDIVLTSPSQIDDYTVRFTAPGLTATLCEEGRAVTFLKDGEPVFVSEVPYMEDANGVQSTDIALSLTEDGTTFCFVSAQAKPS